MHKSLIIMILFYLGMNSYAQENINMIEILNVEQEVISLENRITKLIKKQPSIAKMKGLRQFHILWLGIPYDIGFELKKENYLNHSFLYKLDCGDGYRINSNFLFGKKKEYIQTTTMITDSVGELVAIADANWVYLAHARDPYYRKLAKMLFNKELDFVFLLGSPHSMGYEIGIKENELFGLENSKEGLKIYAWEDFINCCFDDWVHLREKK